MKFEKIELTNFKSFRGSHRFEFLGGNPGLYFMTGQNESEPELETNGVGKSTLYDCIFWTLYGKTLRNLKAQDVASWGVDKKVSADLYLRLHGKPVRIHRGWSPNKLQVADPEPRNVDQQAIDDMLGLSAESFKHAVLFGQFNPMFFDLKPTDKLALFSDVLGLQDWIDRAELAKRQRNEAARKAEEQSTGVARLEGRVETLSDSIEETKAQADSFEDDRKAEIDKLRKQLEESATELEQAKEPLAAAEKKVEKAEQNVEAKRKEVPALEEAVEAVRQEYQQARDKYRDAEAERKRLKTALDKFCDTAELATCPTCGQEIDQEHADAEIEDLREQIKKAKAKADRAQKDANEKQDKLEDEKDALDEAREAVEQARESLRQAEGARDDAKRAVQRREDRVAQIERDIERHKQQDNPYTAKIETAREQLKQAEQDLKEAKTDLDDAERYRDAFDFWAGAFKDIRLEIIEESLRYLEVETNNLLVALGLPGWSVRYDVEKDTKSGTVSRGFHVFIQSPANTREVPWEAWSGGEGQRLRLAGTMGLSNLILSRLGVQPNLEVYDEPTQHTNEKGITDMLDALRDRATALGKQIWVVDHHSLAYGDFRGMVSIVKDKDGSRIM